MHQGGHGIELCDCYLCSVRPAMLMGEAKLVMNEENIYNKPIKPEKLFLESTDLCA